MQLGDETKRGHVGKQKVPVPRRIEGRRSLRVARQMIRSLQVEQRLARCQRALPRQRHQHQRINERPRGISPLVSETRPFCHRVIQVLRACIPRVGKRRGARVEPARSRHDPLEGLAPLKSLLLLRRLRIGGQHRHPSHHPLCNQLRAATHRKVQQRRRLEPHAGQPVSRSIDHAVVSLQHREIRPQRALQPQDRLVEPPPLVATPALH